MQTIEEAIGTQVAPYLTAANAAAYAAADEPYLWVVFNILDVANLHETPGRVEWIELALDAINAAESTRMKVTKNENIVLITIIHLLQFDEYCVDVEQIADECGFPDERVEGLLGSLVKKRLIHEVEKGRFACTPQEEGAPA
jgi:hypothetical protein